jgi:hypothetical protein
MRRFVSDVRGNCDLTRVLMEGTFMFKKVIGFAALAMIVLAPVNGRAENYATLVCKSGQGLYAKYRQSRTARSLRVHFTKSQRAADAGLQPGTCAWKNGPLAAELPAVAFLSRENEPGTFVALTVGPRAAALDYQAMQVPGAPGIGPKMLALLRQIQTTNKVFHLKVQLRNVSEVGEVLTIL